MNMKNGAIDAARHSIKKEAETMLSVLDRLDEEAFGRAVDLLAAAPRIMTGGCGNSGIAAKKFAHCLCCINKSGMFMPSGEAVHGGMGYIQPGDVLVVPYTTNKLLPYIRQAAAVITEEASVECHTATIGLALDKPVIVGAAGAVQRLTDVTMVTVDCARGLVRAMP